MFNPSLITSRFKGGWLAFFVFLSLTMFISPVTKGATGVGRRHIGSGHEETFTVQDFKYLSLQTPPSGYPELAVPTSTPQIPVNSEPIGSYPPPLLTIIRQTPYPIEVDNEAPIDIPTVGVAPTITFDLNAGLPEDLANPTTENTQMSSGIILWIGFLIGLAIFSAAVLGASHYSRRGRQK
jgi:hypothetical protein